MKHIFIVNTYAGNYRKISDLREKLQKIEGLDYKVFNVMHAGGEQELVQKLLRYFNNDKVRIYCCGGSGTFRNVINGIPNLSDVEVAFYPCGLTNDFLHVFGDDAVYFSDIEKVINGKATEIDYVKTNNGIFVNAFTTGLDSEINKKMDSYRDYDIFGENIPYLLSLLYAVFLSKRRRYRLNIDGDLYEDVYSEVAFGKGVSVGGFLNVAQETNLRDGEFNILLAPNRSFIGSMKIILSLIKRDWDRVKGECVIRKGSYIQIEYDTKDTLVANLDGEKADSVSKWEATVVKRGLKFVLPIGVRINER